jgi:hypothetical protein
MFCALASFKLIESYYLARCSVLSPLLGTGVIKLPRMYSDFGLLGVSISDYVKGINYLVQKASS